MCVVDVSFFEHFIYCGFFLILIKYIFIINCIFFLKFFYYFSKIDLMSIKA